MPTNLWPDFEDATLPRSPKAVVEDAGAGLSEKTNGMVVFRASPTSIKGEKVEVVFNLLAPSLYYQYPFMQVSFPITGMYPVTVIAAQWGNAVAKDENELTTLLAKIFTAPSTIVTIQRLMALAKG